MTKLLFTVVLRIVPRTAIRDAFDRGQSSPAKKKETGKKGQLQQKKNLNCVTCFTTLWTHTGKDPGGRRRWCDGGEWVESLALCVYLWWPHKGKHIVGRMGCADIRQQWAKQSRKRSKIARLHYTPAQPASSLGHPPQHSALIAAGRCCCR